MEVFEDVESCRGGTHLPVLVNSLPGQDLKNLRQHAAAGKAMQGKQARHLELKPGHGEVALLHSKKDRNKLVHQLSSTTPITSYNN